MWRYAADISSGYAIRERIAFDDMCVTVVGKGMMQMSCARVLQWRWLSGAEAQRRRLCRAVRSNNKSAEFRELYIKKNDGSSEP